MAFIESLVVLVQNFSNQNITGYLVGNPGYSALLIAAGVIFLISQLKNETKNKTLLLSLTILMSALFLLKSRAVLIGLLFSIPILLPKRKAFLFALMIASISLALLVFFPQFVLRNLKIDAFHPENWTGRLVIWKSAIEAIRNHWLFGWGIGNFEAAYYQHQQPSGHYLRYSLNTVFAHNDYLQLAVVAGIPSLFILAWATTEFLRNNLDQIKKNLEFFSIIVLYATTSLFIFPFYLPMNGIMFFIALGFLFEKREGKTKVSLGYSKTLSVGFLLVSLAGSFTLIFGGIADRFKNRGNIEKATSWAPWRADLWYDRGLKMVSERKKPDEAIQYLEKSVSINPKDPFVWSRLGRTLDPSARNKDYISYCLTEASSLAPKQAPFWVDLGFWSLSEGETKKARQYFRKAMILEPNVPLPYYGLSLIYLKENKNEAAIKLQNRARTLKEKESINAIHSPYSSFLYSVPLN